MEKPPKFWRFLVSFRSDLMALRNQLQEILEETSDFVVGTWLTSRRISCSWFLISWLADQRASPMDTNTQAPGPGHLLLAGRPSRVSRVCVLWTLLFCWGPPLFTFEFRAHFVLGWGGEADFGSMFSSCTGHMSQKSDGSCGRKVEPMAF